MKTKTAEEYSLKAIESFKNRLIVVSKNFRILAASNSQSGAPEKDILGKFCHQVYYNRSEPCDNCAVKVALGEQKPSLCPKPELALLNGHLPCYYAYPIYNGNEIEAFVSMDFDMPAIGMLEEKLNRSYVLMESLLLNAVDCVVAADMLGEIFLFNHSAVQVFGYSKEEALRILNVRNIYPEGVAYEIMKRLRSNEYGGKGRLEGYPVDVVDKNGNLIPIGLNASIIYENDREIATIGFFHDRREKIRMQKDLDIAQVQLLQAEKMASLGKLAAGVAHQLNNPLGGITLFAKLMIEEYNLPENAQSDLNRILKDAERCRDTVKELLEFTRQTRHLMKPNDLNKLLTRTLFLLENQVLFQNIAIHKNFLNDLPLVVSDAQQLNHLFMNIILNAAQAMDSKGTLTISTMLLENKECVRIQISDSGPGIPQNVLPHIFEPFYTTKEEGKGTGLGLSLAYNIIESHGGQISAENNPDHGATFIIDLPLNQKYEEGEKGGE